MIIGISGKVASGKSEVLKVFKKMGFCCIDADKITHEIYKKEQKGAKIIADNFGKDFLNKNGAVNRTKLRKFILSDFGGLKILNKLVHPLVCDEICKFIKKNERKNIAIEAAYFNTDGLLKIVDKIIWIERSGKNIMDVLIKDRGFSKSEAKKFLNLIGMPRVVNYILKNNGKLEELDKKVKMLLY